jgi:hypothetical protein
MTMTFVSLVLIQFFKAYNFRSDRHSVLQPPLRQPWLNLAIVWELVLLALLIVYCRSSTSRSAPSPAARWTGRSSVLACR